MPHAVPKALYDYQRGRFHDGKLVDPIYCPVGHRWYPKGTPEVEKLKERLLAQEGQTLREQQRHDQTKAELRETEQRRRAEKAAKTRIKNRVANGVCPCCRRSFSNLANHMKNQHPDFKAKD